MIRANLIEPKKIIIEEVEKPKPKENEVVIKTKICGICGSDIHAYYGRHPFIKCPIVQGHEFSGEMAEIGNNVKELKIGQKVTVVPHITCGKCYNCKRGKHNLCKELKFIGCQTTGAMAEYVVVPANFVIPLPDNISFEEGALIEPLAVGIHAVKRADIKENSRVLILGSGPIGLMTLLAAKSFGAGQVVISDLSDYRLSVAKELGAEYIVNISKENLIEYVRSEFGDEGIDFIFECVGAEECVRCATEIARKGSSIVIVGVFGKETKIQMSLVQDKELNIYGSASYLIKDFIDAIRLIDERKVNLKPLISKRFNLKEIQTAYELIEKERDKILKVLIEI